METGSQQSSGRGVFLSARLVFLAVALVLLVRPSAAQQLTQQWANTIPNGEAGTGTAVAADTEDNLYVVGTVCADSACQTSVLNLVKYEKNGTTAWSTALSSAPAGGSRGVAVALDGAGNVYVAGIAAMISNGPAPGINQLVVAKFSSSGQQLWASYNTSTTDTFGYTAPVLAVDSAGDSYASTSYGDTFGPITTIEYDPNGNQLWLASYSLMAFGLHGHAQEIAVDTQGDTYLAVEADDASGFTSNYSGLLLKYDPSGNLLWAYHAAHAPPAGFVIDPQRNAYLASLLGPSTEASNAATAEQVTKLDPNGNVLWNAQYAPANIPSPSAIALDSAGNSYVTGGVGSNANNSAQYSTSKFDANGNFLWEKDYSTQDSEANGIVVDQQNNIIVSGTTNIVLGTGKGNATTIEYDTNGNQLSVATYNNDTPEGIALGKAAIFVGGTYFNGNPSPTANAQIQNSRWVTLEYEEGSGSTINIAPASLTFANQNVGSTSTAQTVTVTNTGTAALNVTAAPAISGTNAGDFAIGSGTTCTNGASIPGNGSCVINITFSPSTTSSEGPATLTVTDGDSSSPQTIALSGAGTAAPAPAVSFSANTLTFPSQPEGTTSGAQSVTLTNTGNASLSVSSVTITGSNASEFAKTNVTCESSLAAGASCIIAVDFQPSATGTQTASISVADNAPSSPQTVTLTGTGSAAAAPAVGLAPSPLDFMAQVVSTTSTAQTITLTNTGNAALTISGITVAGSDAKEFPVGSSACGKSLAAGAKCAIPISFAPTAAGAQTATLTVADNATPATQTVSLSGTGSNFALSSANTSATVNAGQTATYTVTLSPTSFTGAVAVTCSGAPTAATCAANPASVNLAGSTAAQVTVTVATTAASGGFPALPLNGQRMLWASALAAILIGLLALSGLRGYRMKPSLVLMLVLLITCLGCGSTSKPSSGSESNSPSNPTNPSNPTSPGTSGTPAGTSTITVTATAGPTVRTLPLTLTVD